jgi:hypothetical protein
VRALATALLLTAAASADARDGEAQKSSPRPPSSPPRAAQPSTAAAIRDIRARYAEVGRRLKSFRSVKRDASGLSAEGGDLRAYFDRDTLRLVRATTYGEMGRAAHEVYYDEEGRPFFVFLKEARYARPFGRVASERTHRFYFRDRRMIRWLDGARQVSPADPRYAAREKEVLDLADSLAELARRP